MGSSGEDDLNDALPQPEPPPGRTSSSGVTGNSSVSAPRAARFGEGREGGGARRERGLTGPRQGFFGRLGQFVHDVRSELNRVTWPSLTDVRNTTIITIVAVIFFAVYLFVIDWGFTQIIGQLAKLVS